MVRSFPSGTEVHKIIQDRINSREWWLIPVIDEEGIAFVQEIACRFYRDNRKGVMDAILIPFPTLDVPGLWLVLAAKSCLSQAQLAEYEGLPLDEEFKSILVPPSTPLSVMVWLYQCFRFPAGADQLQTEASQS
jgi:hypothetical protein